jgi:hypothetical protein
MLMRHPQLDPVELAGSLDGWLKQNANLPALKKLRRDSTCSLQSLDAWMDTGIVSPAPGSPSWFRMQPSPSLQATRASPSLDIQVGPLIIQPTSTAFNACRVRRQVLSPVVPESYPEDMDMMSDGDGDIPPSPPSPGPLMCTPRMDKFMSSPGNTPRRRAPSRLGWRSSPKRDPNQGLATAPQTDKAPPHSNDPDPPAAATAAAAAPAVAAAAPESCAASAEAHEAAELRSLECRFLQLLHAGSGMVLVTDALRLFRGYMDAEEDKEAVRSMLKRWCVLVEHPVGSGCRWLYLRSAAEAAGATLPDC